MGTGINAELVIRPHNPLFNEATNFVEQIAVLYRDGVSEGRVKMIRSFLHVGAGASVGFDPLIPQYDTSAGWKYIEKLIDDGDVCGTFHTHPPGIKDFSETDWQVIRGLAKAYGKKLLYHGVRAAGGDKTHWIAVNLVGGSVLVYDFGYWTDKMDYAIVLPLPAHVVYEHVCLVLSCE